MVSIFSSDNKKYNSSPTKNNPKLIATKLELIFSFLSRSNCPYLLKRRNRLLTGAMTHVENAIKASTTIKGIKYGCSASLFFAIVLSALNPM